MDRAARSGEPLPGHRDRRTRRRRLRARRGRPARTRRRSGRGASGDVVARRRLSHRAHAAPLDEQRTTVERPVADGSRLDADTSSSRAGPGCRSFSRKQPALAFAPRDRRCSTSACRPATTAFPPQRCPSGSTSPPASTAFPISTAPGSRSASTGTATPVDPDTLRSCRVEPDPRRRNPRVASHAISRAGPCSARRCPRLPVRELAHRRLHHRPASRLAERVDRRRRLGPRLQARPQCGAPCRRTTAGSAGGNAVCTDRREDGGQDGVLTAGGRSGAQETR